MKKRSITVIAITAAVTLAVLGFCLANSLTPVNDNVSKGEMKALYDYRGTSLKHIESVAGLVDKLPYLAGFYKDYEAGEDSLSFSYAPADNAQQADLDGIRQDSLRNGAILFALVDDLDVLRFQCRNGEESDVVSYQREAFEQQFGSSNTDSRERFEAFLKGLETAQFQTEASLLPQALQEKLTAMGYAEVNRAQTYERTAVIEQDIALMGFSAEELAERYGYDLKQYYGKPVSCYIYDAADLNQPTSSQKRIFLSVVCDGREVYGAELASDEQRQQVITYIDMAAERFLH